MKKQLISSVSMSAIAAAQYCNSLLHALKDPDKYLRVANYDYKTKILFTDGFGKGLQLS